jgi:predicted transcriptional regulator
MGKQTIENALKWSDDDESSGSIVLAFDPKWRDPLLNREVEIVFRKRGPSRTQLGFLYAYIGTPICAIVGRAKVIKYQKMPVSEAINLAGKGRIDPAELLRYAHRRTELGVFRLGKFEPFNPPLGLKQLALEFGFAAPQNFFFLSARGKASLDERAGVRHKE